MWNTSSCFSLRYDDVVIKQLSSCSFDKKVVNFWKIKNHLYQVPSTIWENVVFGDKII